MPVCPHCGAAIEKLTSHRIPKEFRLQFPVAMLCCPECDKVLGTTTIA